MMHLRNLKKKRTEVSIYDPIGYDKEGNEIALIDILAEDNEIVDMVDMKMQGEKILSKINVLNERERQIIEMRYGVFTGMKEPQREIARKMGISRSYVSRIEKRALKKLIRELSTES